MLENKYKTKLFDIIMLGDYMIQEFLQGLKSKYQYDDNILKAIEISINLMIKKYGNEALNDILELFNSIPIFPFVGLNQSIVNEQMKERFEGNNLHIIEDEEENIYGTSSVGSVYCYNSLFNENMEVVGESKFIIVEDKKGTTNENDYLNTFGTTINIPYFLHEVNHAYGMQKKKYVNIDNQILCKHGLFTSVIDYKKEGDKYHISTTSGKDIVFEEIINQMITQDMLCDFFNVNSYNEVKPILDSIKYVPMEYDSLLVFIGRELSFAMGEQAIMDFRRENDESVIEEFNNMAGQSDIAIEYLDGIKPLEYFVNKTYDLFQLVINKYKYGIEKYGELSAELMLDSLAPVYAYADKKNNTVTLEKYRQQREKVMSPYNNPDKKLD